MINKIISKLIHFPEWCAEFTARLKRKIKLNNLRQIATIGNHFCYREYNNMDGAYCNIYNHNSKDSIQIGNYVKLNGTLFCNKKGSISIGDYTSIGKGTVINADNLIDIGNYCFIANDVLIYDNNSHPISPALRRKQMQNLHNRPIDNYEAENGIIAIKDDVWIGIRAIILKNVIIGKGSVVAAGSIVTNDVLPGSIVAGNPARVVKKITEKT